MIQRAARPFVSVKKVAECHFFEFFSFGACAYGAASTECRESLAAQALFADLTHLSPNPNKAIRGCGPLSTPGFFDRLNGLQGPFLFSVRLFHVEHFSAFIYLFYVEH